MASILNDQLPTRTYPSESMFDPSIRNTCVIWLFWFCACFYPITISGFGVNYLFVITPLLYLILGGRLNRLPMLLKFFGVLLIVIFLIATTYQIDHVDEGFRRIISFLLFMSIFSLSFLNLKPRDFNSALIALIFVSCLLSLVSIYKLLSLGLLQSAFEAKDEVGSQRIGFLLIFSFWALLRYGIERNIFIKIITASLACVILTGIIITYSRASIVSFIGSAILYLMISGHAIRFSRLANPFLIAVATIIALMFVTLVEFAFPSIYQFLNERLFDFIISGRIVDNILDPQTSEGTRFRIWSDVLDYVVFNPVTGSGFLGSWILGIDAGSSHNQYIDVFLRLGFIGFFVYVFLLWRIWILLLKNNVLLFCGFSGVLIYGIFHETFKEPGGALLLALLLSYYSSIARKKTTVSQMHACFRH